MPIKLTTRTFWNFTIDGFDGKWSVLENDDRFTEVGDAKFVNLVAYNKHFVQYVLQCEEPAENKKGKSLRNHPGWKALVAARSGAVKSAEATFLKTSAAVQPSRLSKRRRASVDAVPKELTLSLPSVDGERAFETSEIITLRSVAMADPFAIRVMQGGTYTDDFEKVIRFIVAHTCADDDTVLSRAYSHEKSAESGNNYTKYGRYPKTPTKGKRSAGGDDCGSAAESEHVDDAADSCAFE